MAAPPMPPDGSPPSGRTVLHVRDVAFRAKQMLESGIGRVWIEGEVSNFTHAASGHMYFTLKDDQAQLQAAFFRGAQRGMSFAPRHGMHVVVYGQVTAYPARSQIQVIVERMEEAGAGKLQKAFEKLKAKLAAEGLFEPERKRPIPLLPGRIAVITSPTGAAVRDILNVLGRRFPGIPVLIVPVRVQGEGAAEEIAAALDLAGERKLADVIIVGRGGGSLEDLWAFNEEAVARAVARCPLPVISAVGHETDFTICDFVADVRAPTPSAAAELAVPARVDLRQRTDALRRRLARALQHQALTLKQRLVRAEGSHVFREPGVLVTRTRERLAERHRFLARALRGAAQERQQRLDDLHGRLGTLLGHRADRARDRVDTVSRRWPSLGAAVVPPRRRDVEALRQRLHALSPLAVLDRGYSITYGPHGVVLRRAADTAPGVRLTTRLADGTVESEVSSTTAPHQTRKN